MKIIVLGAGHVGRTLVEALHEEHDLTVIDVDTARLARFADRYDLRTVHGDGTTRKVMRKAEVDTADLLLACSSREEANLVCAMLVKRLSGAKTIVRTTSIELLEAWREGEIDVDFMISPGLETANAIAGIVGLPAARQTDVFAEGKVQIVEFDVPPDASNDALIGRPLRLAEVPADSKVAGLIRGDRMVLPRGDEKILAADRIVVIASPESARTWSRLLAHGEHTVDDVVIFGAGRMGTTIARVLLGLGIRVRLVEGRGERAHEVAEELPEVRVFHADAFDPEFLERQRVGHAAAVFCMNDDAKNLYGAVLAKVHGVGLTIALMHDPAAAEVYERGGVDVAINPRQAAAEEMVRFRARPTYPADRDARGRPLRDSRHHRAPGLRAREQAVQGAAADQLADRRGDPGRHGDVPPQLRRAVSGRPGDPVRRVPPRVGRGSCSVAQRAARHPPATPIRAGATCFLRLMTPSSSSTPSTAARPKARSTRVRSPATSRCDALAMMSVSMRTSRR
jgi:trk system potassium uptake protein TrkA